LAGTKLYCLVTEAHRCKQLAQGCYAALPRAGFEPATYWSQVQRLTAAPPRHLGGYSLWNLKLQIGLFFPSHWTVKWLNGVRNAKPLNHQLFTLAIRKQIVRRTETAEWGDTERGEAPDERPSQAYDNVKKYDRGKVEVLKIRCRLAGLTSCSDGWHDKL